jgi:nucleotide-binding universal stress UspA family protein
MSAAKNRPSEMPLLVVGYDRHPAAQSALAMAAELAGRLQARLLVLHVVDLEDYPIDPDADDWETHAERVVAAERASAQALLAAHRLPWSFQVKHGDAAQQVLELATRQDALMIVIGASRHEWSANLLTGPVAKHLTRHADRPVLLVPE